MVFNSLSFAVFFGVVLLLHALPLPWRVKKLNLVVFSALFYAAYRPPFLLVLLTSATVDYNLARLIWRVQNARMRRALMLSSVALNLGLLAYFKYRDLGIPLGISFYTFESISYIVDVHKRRTTPAQSFLDYALFLSFFPHLVAGPVVRAGHMLPQFHSERSTSLEAGSLGVSLIVLGLFQKVVLADALFAPLVDGAFADVAKTSFVDAWLGCFLFSGQIFCDFSGYSSCAIGAALCLGFELPENFRSPLGSLSIREFWRRWHVSLSSWFRDYVYIPLGGNSNAWRTYLNVIITFALCGIWHGAGWNFLIWGLLHGVFVTLDARGLGRLPRWLALVRVHLLLAIAWLFFRAASLTDALTLAKTMLHPSAIGSTHSLWALAAGITAMAGLIGMHVALGNTSLRDELGRVRWQMRAAVLSVLMLMVCLSPGVERAFIYFQF